MDSKQKMMIAVFVVIVLAFSGVTVMTQENDADDRYTIQVVTNPDFAPYDYLVS